MSRQAERSTLAPVKSAYAIMAIIFISSWLFHEFVDVDALLLIGKRKSVYSTCPCTKKKRPRREWKLLHRSRNP